MSAGLNQLIPELRQPARDLVDAAGAAGLLPRVTSTLRTYAEQKRLYNRYVAGLSQFPAAPPGHSAHEYGWAFDIVVTPLDALADVGAYWESLGGVWGANADPIHFEYPGFQAALGPSINAAAAADAGTDVGGFDVFLTALSFTDLPFAALELLYIAGSRAEAEKVLAEFHVLGAGARRVLASIGF